MFARSQVPRVELLSEVMAGSGAAVGCSREARTFGNAAPEKTLGLMGIASRCFFLK